MILLCLSVGLVGSCKTISKGASYGYNYNGSNSPISEASINETLALHSPTSIPNAKRYKKDLRKILAKKPEFIGKMTGQDIALALRDPDLERRDFPAIIWQYRAETCVLDVYFQSDSDQNTPTAQPYEMQVQYFEFRQRGGDILNGAEASNCLNQINGSRLANMRSNTHAISLLSAQSG